MLFSVFLLFFIKCLRGTVGTNPPGLRAEGCWDGKKSAMAKSQGVLMCSVSLYRAGREGRPICLSGLNQMALPASPLSTTVQVPCKALFLIYRPGPVWLRPFHTANSTAFLKPGAIEKRERKGVRPAKWRSQAFMEGYGAIAEAIIILLLIKIGFVTAAYMDG